MSLKTGQTKTVYRIKLALFLFLFFMLAGFGVFYFVDRLTSVKSVDREINIDSDASLSLNSMQHTSTRNGIKEWTLRAASAKVLKNEQKALIKDISVEFYLKNGEQVLLTSKQGYINTKENSIALSDNVTVKYGDFILNTDQLHYDKKNHILYSNSYVVATNKDSVLKSDTMKFDLNNNRLSLKGNVYAILSNALDFTK